MSTERRPFPVRLNDAEIQQIDDLRRVEIDVPTRSEMVRRLIKRAHLSAHIEDAARVELRDASAALDAATHAAIAEAIGNRLGHHDELASELADLALAHVKAEKSK